MFLDNYFPKELRKAEIITVCKKDKPLKKENSRPVCTTFKDFRKIDL